MISDSELNPAAVEIGNFLAHEPGAVWRALTDPDLLELWLMRSVGFTASVGTHFIFVVPTHPTEEIACEVLTCHPPEHILFTWVDLRATHPARWLVDWTLAPQGRGTRLLVTHTGFDLNDRRQKMARNALERGWKSALTRLREVLDHTES
ncbi:SRPBCC domain-containing protein [Nocardia terpenica]|uniref:SRPBCC family protein n=1 Tax=Nocardia terpenica TaxID=455432 RepID=UPI002FE075DD